MTKPSNAVARSAITNGKFLRGIDGRSTWARRARDLFEQLVSDLGGGDAVSEAERLLARRAAIIASELERREVEFAQAGAVDDDSLDVYQRATSALRRTLDSLGLQRRPRPLTDGEIVAIHARGRT